MQDQLEAMPVQFCAVMGLLQALQGHWHTLKVSYKPCRYSYVAMELQMVDVKQKLDFF